MAEISWILENGQEASMSFDATVREDHTSAAMITTHPVEEGSNISDHVRDDLDRVSLQINVSNTPIAVPTDHADGVTGSQQQVELFDASGARVDSAQALVFDGTLTRVRSVYEALRDLKSAGQRVMVITSLREYEDMLIEKILPTREAVSGNALVATVEFLQIRIVTSEIVDAPEPRETRGNRREERGRDNPDEEDDDNSERSQSVLSSLGEGLAGFFR